MNIDICKIVPVHTTQACEGGGSRETLILNHGTRWGREVRIVPPPLYPTKKLRWAPPHTGLDIYTLIHTHIHTHAYTYTHIHTHSYTHTHIHMHTHIHIHAHTYTYIHTHTYTYIHTHTYTHIQGVPRVKVTTSGECSLGQTIPI